MKFPLLYLIIFFLLFSGCNQTQPSSLTNYESSSNFTGFVIKTFDSSALVYTEESSLISFKALEANAEIGDRIDIKYDEVEASFPGQATAISSKVVSPPKPDGATYTEKEAINLAYQEIAHIPPADEYLDYRYVIYTNYQGDTDKWLISIFIYGEDEGRIVEVK
ncbi:hypothetical protein [Shouchella patagoniensis]|uniref:hypothetical protein n=1 Tax=Shouchella patagoniensis TaxID=228576 RepID=UPI000994F5A5|nr:hypothetical protein [Shouchella patagoniensis]